MANFLLQNDPGTLDFETTIAKDLLQKEKDLHSYQEMTLEKLKLHIENETLVKNLIPIGTIEFVSTYIKYAYGVEKENPIEIPTYLRTEEFLKRKYETIIEDWSKQK